MKIKRIFRGTEYEITIDNTAHAGNSVKATYVDGKLLETTLIQPNGGKHSVLVVMG